MTPQQILDQLREELRTEAAVLLEDSLATVQRQRQEIQKTTQLVEYYRQFAPYLPSIGVPPPGYFAHQLDQGSWVSGRLVDGRLEILSQGHEHEEDAVEQAWTHYHAQVG